ncbi:MAG TPA: hypothetical protein VJU77_00290 [Chthoniobacterales bacterium]|nr:hypothetical protein [Chthoniobacterales bacterium]
MRRLLLICLIALAAPARGAIDFSPTVTSYSSEGAEYANVAFKDEQRTVTLTLPRLWSCRGDASRLQFAPPNQNFAEGLVQAASMKGLLRFDEPTVKSLEQQVLSTLPSGSQGAALVSQQENPVILNGNLSYEFIVAYQTLGQAFLRSVIIVACPDQQLIFKFSAPKSVFDNLNRSFRQSIVSWRLTEPSNQSVLAAVTTPQAPTKTN